MIANVGVTINLDKYVERGQITSDSDEVRVWSPEDRHLVGTSLHTVEGFELITFLFHL
jgi:hypothetical protein